MHSIMFCPVSPMSSSRTCRVGLLSQSSQMSKPICRYTHRLWTLCLCHRWIDLVTGCGSGSRHFLPAGTTLILFATVLKACETNLKGMLSTISLQSQETLDKYPGTD
jgi:hypothetical protein